MEINSFEDILKYCREMKATIPEVMIEYEIRKTGRTREQIIEGVRKILNVMIESVNNGLTRDVKSPSGLLNNFAKKVYNAKVNTLTVNFKKAIARAMAVSEVNACMGRIAAAPTAGSSGIMPAVITTMMEEHGITEDKAIEGLLVSSAIGLLIVKNASVAGSEAGCMGETGSAAAMGASAIVYLLGGDNRQIESAACFAIQGAMGLVCDPIAGLVEVPCIFRNAIGVANAFTSAQIALSGVESVIPLDEVILAMNEVAELMSPKLKETAQGGLANTKTAREIQRRFIYQIDIGK
ncbi:L-serine ammonia-lyase [Candidatus Kryptonium thompsonii]|uniref:L-serine dehydratase n=1 Tax=Candidatus Kryptonium thompsonii TaxID=1633631 RepID=A0A0P1MMV2_9BACT|nr:L-serine ammonia-lyase, iron-sulfur-dependent, subunit alpha [Candidatus Kryptonium thompsoni]CUS78606.1 L-serine ammonia-lyase [Candidatus Kryptonium thompsoni]CUS79616.1 L-serine ammonia-lyase [Candidatus Kryptonium thompsoni]CUS82120.1 L-serine ammonia-lyase [Candidatus Kryptonium thompsoni]CUS84820.1 L-serine ammonia-lyase [Candidatus Kryptonium thompsoni]CUS84917.1 L-serine ammonia-lyase [Candidatus Kryptonium thompsoni]